MTMLCTICARGGSKGVPGKNVRDISGQAADRAYDRAGEAVRPVRGHRRQQRLGRHSGAATAFGADILVRRPDELASDTRRKVPAIRHCLESAERALGRQFPCSSISMPPRRCAHPRTSSARCDCSKTAAPPASLPARRHGARRTSIWSSWMPRRAACSQAPGSTPGPPAGCAAVL